MTSESCVNYQKVIRDTASTQKNPCVLREILCRHRDFYVSTQEVVLTLCQPFQSNSETLCRHRKIAVYSTKSACVDTKNEGIFLQTNLVSTIK